MSDTTMTEEAETLLDDSNSVDETDLESTDPPTEEPDTQEDTSPKGEETEAVVEPKPETEESTEEVQKLAEDHNPDATLEEETSVKEPEKVPQHRIDATKLAEKWDTLSEDDQLTKLNNLKKSGRTATLDGLAGELGTTVDKMFAPFKEEEHQSEIDILRAKVAEHDNALGYANKQATLDRYATEINKYAVHNKLTTDESKALTAIDGELFETFEALKFDPKTGEKLTFKGRLKLALNNTDSVQDLIAAKKAGAKLNGMKEGLKASLPGGGEAASTATANWENLEGEELLAAQDAKAGKSSWEQSYYQ